MNKTKKISIDGNTETYTLIDGRVMQRVRHENNAVYYYLEGEPITGTEFRDLIGEPHNG
ncbi:hypothetical protein HP439_13005 [Sphingobacterium shayense]|uniref:hypothetical protein n=1 Tax=Sphingobacterium shayense TaxID=626343 RepID=UPI001557048A|nr:hypothetical protein [Sphingobacterium shayense]NQD71641.1 hypothetical protein [Sphingobacterium shayense]